MSSSPAEDPSILKESWYHGFLPREDMACMLKERGDFVVRFSEPIAGQQRCYIISVMTKVDFGFEIKHFVIKRYQECFAVKKDNFPSIKSLIEYYVTSQESISTVLDSIIIINGKEKKEWELNHDEIKLTKKLGDGAFGEVMKGELKQDNICVPVAVKKLSSLEKMSKEMIKEIMHEARLMRKFNHPNVTKIYGVATGTEPLYIVMELANEGALDSYLQKNEISIDKKIKMCCDAAFGLEYLHSIPVLHRDIAARNCLIGDGKVKIADFGLTREGTYIKIDGNEKLPLRWISPETLKKFYYTRYSDVFSYGILVWEIYSNGKIPYEDMNPTKAAIKVAKHGHRLSLPDDIPSSFKDLIKIKCWADKDNERCTMTEIVDLLCKLTSNERPFKVPALDYNTGVTNKAKKFIGSMLGSILM
ncbi:Tyrosine-protein kinase Fps85D [Strongyloides ratti]|uniref:Tyrosine-protein kinase n=1 Tax=Strongyloides ratti TaxID=34506 RepID=A0A090LDD4_STRRB|nr:Tyrosine-protein kinase Fps85D [Strongyloides ratti]CEF67791.1 Tyrosine-protein kinase Fps85D [Strongyloides ratti]